MIIFQKGSKIKELQKKTNTRIQFKDNQQNGELVKEDNSERIVNIRGPKLNVYQAELELKKLLLDSPAHFQEDYLVRDNVCGRLIGKKGANIKELCKFVNCKINIGEVDEISSQATKKSSFMNQDNKFKKLTICGTIDQIEIAKVNNLSLN